MAEVLVGKLIADKYRIVRRLGGGGMGTVYVAVQEPLGREVALKVIRRDLSTDERTLERFRREAMTLSQIHHPHIVTLMDFGELPSGSLYFAMELVKGEHLRQRLMRDGALPLKSGVNIVRACCAALSAAHALGIIHRDLKPENILIMDAPGVQDFIKIVDFGVAKLTGANEHHEEHGEQLTARGSVVGTPGYIPPEVAVRGVTTDPRSDLYSLGVVWYELLAGKRPFHATTPTALLMAHAMDPIPALPSSIPLPIAGLVQRLLAKAPEDRPESAEELAALIDKLPAFEPSGPLSRPPAISATPGAKTINDSQESMVTESSVQISIAVGSGGGDSDEGMAKTELTERKAVEKLVAMQEHAQGPLGSSSSASRQARGPFVVAAVLGAVVVMAGAVAIVGKVLRPPKPAVDAGTPVVVITSIDAGAGVAPLVDAGSAVGPTSDAGAGAAAVALDAGPKAIDAADAGTKKKKKKKADGGSGDGTHVPDIYSD